MRMFIIIVVAALVVLGGGGGAAWWFLLQEPKEQEVAENAAEPINTQPEFVQIDTIVIPVIREGTVLHHLSYSLQVEVRDSDAKFQLYESFRQLRDAFIVELHSLAAMRFVQQGNYDIHLIKTRLKLAGEKIVGKNVIEAILVRHLAKRRPNRS